MENLSQRNGELSFYLAVNKVTYQRPIDLSTYGGCLENIRR
jgi:hypothetical protein